MSGRAPLRKGRSNLPNRHRRSVARLRSIGMRRAYRCVHAPKSSSIWKWPRSSAAPDGCRIGPDPRAFLCLPISNSSYVRPNLYSLSVRWHIRKAYARVDGGLVMLPLTSSLRQRSLVSIGGRIEISTRASNRITLRPESADQPRSMPDELDLNGHRHRSPLSEWLKILLFPLSHLLGSSCVREFANQINFSSSALATACVLFVTSSLHRLDVTWKVTVRSVMPRILPISSAVFPTALQRNTSRSRAVS